MKFRIIASILVILFLVIVWAVLDANNSTPAPVQSDSGLTISR